MKCAIFGGTPLARASQAAMDSHTRITVSKTEGPLRALCHVARVIAANKELDVSQIRGLLDALEAASTNERQLLGVMRQTVDSLPQSASARRKFFHATRAYVNIQLARMEEAAGGSAPESLRLLADPHPPSSSQIVAA
jgi:hypothetical protein